VTAKSNIIGIHGVRHEVEARGSIPLPKSLITLRKSIATGVKDLLRKLFDNADDSLFAMADKAGTNGDQAMYFDAMRELRLQKKKIATSTIHILSRSFNDINDTNSDKQGLPETLDDLSLIQNDELETNVAQEGMVTRLRNVSGSSLQNYHARFESIISSKIRVENVPASPEILCEAFVTSCGCLDVPLKAKLFVFKLFEKYVLCQMPAIYEEANQSFSKMGILPRLSDSVPNVNRINTSAKTNIANNIPSRHSDFNDNTSQGMANNIPVLNADQCLSGGQFENLRNLMHQSETASSIDGQSDIKHYPQQDLLSALSQFQFQQTENEKPSGEHTTLDFRNLLNNVLQPDLSMKKYSDMDSDVINLVSMLFDFILDDRQLQPAMKALISRLQIPILKVAIIDRSFFDRGGHPARKLLNEIASAAIGWNEKKDGKRDRLKEKIEGIVGTILDDFDSNIEIFTALLSDFELFIELEQRRGLLVEQRTKDSEKGKAANDLAKQAVESTLNELLQDRSIKDKQVPACVLDLFNEAWSRVMTLHHLKSGQDSREWSRARKTASQLISSVCPDENEPDIRQTLVKSIPKIMRSLRESLSEISFDEFRMKTLFKAIENEHVKIMSHLKKVITPNLNSSNEYSDPQITESSTDRQDDVIADLVRETLEMEEDFKKFQIASVPAPLVNEPEPTTITSTADSTIPRQTNAFVQQVENLVVGCWFEFSGDEQPERCKLAAVIKASGKYIFVNRSGVKVAEKSKLDLAEEMSKGCIQILNDGLLFDRALESVIGNLRNKSN